MALIADYGGDGSASLRGVLNHQFVDVLETQPGTCDITADVDFSLLKRGSFGLGETIDSNNIVDSCGPIDQADFLEAMGVGPRLEMLLSVVKTKEARDNLRKGVDRIMSRKPGGMGKLYQFMAMVPKGNGHPYAFYK
jgi:NADH dehydrogenase [ubiquinone] 1 alpha subcomplex assembly factor 7